VYCTCRRRRAEGDRAGAVSLLRGRRRGDRPARELGRRPSADRVPLLRHRQRGRRDGPRPRRRHDPRPPAAAARRDERVPVRQGLEFTHLHLKYRPTPCYDKNQFDLIFVITYAMYTDFRNSFTDRFPGNSLCIYGTNFTPHSLRCYTTL